MASTRIRKGPSGPFDNSSIDPGDLTPGPLNTALRTLDEGDGPVAAWQPATGGGGAYFVDYLERAGNNDADALILLLTEITARPLAVFLPARDLVIDKQIGDFAGGDGLGSGLTFIGVAGATRFVRPAPLGYQAMFAWGQGSSRVTFQGVGFHAEATDVVGLKAIQAYEYDRWRFFDCEVTTGDVPTNQGNGIAIGLFGGTRATFVDSFLDHAQVGFGGLGYGCNGVVFANNQCENVHDYAMSAVTGPPEVSNLEVRNVVVSNNTINGVNGSGAIFVGSDGGSSPADVVSGVVIQGNVITPVVEMGHVGLRAMITFCGGLETDGVSILGNTFADDTESTQGIYGIMVSQPPAATSMRRLCINYNTIGSLGADGGAHGIHCDCITVDASQIIGNTLDGNRGILLSNWGTSRVADNQIYRATSTALTFRATERDCLGLDVSKNYVEAEGPSAAAILFQVVGSHAMQAWIDDNKLSSATGSALAFIPDGGTGEFYETDTKYLLGEANAAMIAATIFKRDPSSP